MTFDANDTVSAYRMLSDALRRASKDVGLSVAVFCWARIGEYCVASGSLTRESLEKSGRLIVAMIEDKDDPLAEKFANEQAGVARLCHERGRELIEASFWICGSYLFRYISNPQFEFQSYILDTYLAALEDLFLEDSPSELALEVKNLIEAFKMFGSIEMYSAEFFGRLIEWAWSSPLGKSLRDF